MFDIGKGEKLSWQRGAKRVRKKRKGIGWEKKKEGGDMNENEGTNVSVWYRLGKNKLGKGR